MATAMMSTMKTLTMNRVFLDTNVFGYWASDGDDHCKERIAVELIERLAISGGAVISPQVITEFINISRKAHMRWMRPRAVRRAAEEFVTQFEMVSLDTATTREALRVYERYRLRYPDAQIWAAARVSGCDAILTEDTHGTEIEGVRYINPFERGFEIESLLG